MFFSWFWLLATVGATYNEECSNFLATEPRAMDVTFTGPSTVSFTTWDMDHKMQHELELWTLGAIAEDNDTTTLCVSFTMTNTRVLHGEDLLVNAEIHVWGYVESALVNVTTDCWSRNRTMQPCDPVFIPKPEAMATSLFARTPLREDFWTQLNDTFTKGKWLRILRMESVKGNMPSSYVAHVRESELISLKMTGNNWGKLDKLLSDLPELETVDFSFNNIQELPPDTFTNTPKMRDIILAKNNLTTVPYGLEGLKELARLDMTNPEGDAKLVISNEAIPSLRGVATLGLENTNLAVNVTAVLELPKLAFLNLSGCGIHIIDDVSFSPQETSLRELDLSRNELSKLPPKLFKSLNKIHSLYLSHNAFDSCPTFFESLHYLTRLDLSYNKLSRLTTLCFDKAHESLNHVDLSHNQLSHIADGAFQTLHNLRELILSHNKLSTLQTAAFRGASYLRLLDLSYNELPSGLQFTHIDIQELNLSDNRLVSLRDLAGDVTSIKILDVSRNNISQLSVPHSVERLNVSYNAISSLPRELRDSLDRRRLSIDLGGNFLNCCDTQLDETSHWLRETHVDVQNLGTKTSLRCLIPGENQVYSSRTFVDEEGMCLGSGDSRRTGAVCNTSPLYAVIGCLTLLVVALSGALGYLVFKHKPDVLTWFKFADHVN